MTFIGWHGDPCCGNGCAHRAVKHRAEHFGLCLSCFAGATEQQRRMASFEASGQPDPLEALFDLPAAEPSDAEPEQWGEAA